MNFAKRSGVLFSTYRRTPMYYTLADPRNRVAVILASIFSLSLALIIYLLKIYIAGPAMYATPISSVKSDIVVQSDGYTTDPYITVSEDVNFTSSASTFNTSFIRLFDLASPGVTGSGSALQYQIGITQVDGVETPRTALSRGEYFYTYPIKSGVGSFANGSHHLSIDYSIQGPAVVQHEGRSHLTWNLFHPWPGRTGSVSSNVILPVHVGPNDPIVSTEIWEKGDLVSRDKDVRILIRDYRMMGDGIPRVMVSFQTERQLEKWEYVRVVLSWPSP